MSEAEASDAITKGAVRLISDPNATHKIENPVLQCLHVKPMASKPGDKQERYRVILSDTEYFVQAMLGSSQRNLVTENILKVNSIVRLTQFTCSEVNKKRIVILPGLEVLTEYGEPERIGKPVSIDTTAQTGGQTAQGSEVSGSGFYGNSRPAPPQAVSHPNPNRNATSDSSHGNLYPIEALSPYAHKWTIRARVTHKSPIKTWHNANGEGRLYSINLLDESGEIRGTAFHSVGEVFDQWYEMLQEGSVYYISNPCSVRMAKKQFTQINNDYELMFEKDTRIEKAEDQGSVPQIRYNFTSIGDLQSVEKDTTIDAIGILKEIGEVAQIVSKTSKPFDKRELTLVDNTLHQVRLTIWGETANTFDAPLESVVAFKGVKVSDFGGRSLSLLSSGSMTVGPDIDEAHKLKGWYDAQGRSDQYTSHQNTMSAGTGRNDVYKTIAEVKDENLGMSDTPDYFTLKATIVFIKQANMYYAACQSERCNKKVIEIEIGQWRCESCDKTWDKPQHRYVMSMNAADFSGQLWLSFFDDSASLILGKSADEMQELQEAGDEGAVNSIVQDATCKTYIFRCRAKMDTYKDESRVRYQVSSTSPVNFPLECAKLTEQIKAYNISDSSLFV